MVNVVKYNIDGSYGFWNGPFLRGLVKFQRCILFKLQKDPSYQQVRSHPCDLWFIMQIFVSVLDGHGDSQSLEKPTFTGRRPACFKAGKSAVKSHEDAGSSQRIWYFIQLCWMVENNLYIVLLHAPSHHLAMFRLLFWDKELHGRPDLPSTVCANATAESLGEIILPLAIWLGLCLNGEQPGSSLLWKWSGH